MCSGSLAPGCRILGIFATRSQVYGVIWHAWCLYFGVLGDPETILGRSWDIGGHEEGPCEVQAWILLIFSWFLGPILRAFWELLDQKRSFFSISISRLLFLLLLSLNLGVWDWKTCIWHGRYCKNQLSQKLDFLWFQGRFFMILGSLGTTFHGFCCLGDCLENSWIFMWFWGHPRSWEPSGVRAMAPLFWGQ